MIVLDGLTKRFGDVTAVHNLSFQVGKAEIFGLIGPDGAGKTTTMRVLATAMMPTAGHVSVGGIDTARDAEAVKKLIGYMPQRFALYPDLTVLENLNFFGDMYDSPPAERKQVIAQLLGFSRLTAFQTRRAANLSGGMQKKLALAATLMHRPRVLLLDEPTTGVDPVSRREFWDLLTQVHLDGVTIVVSTPYLDEAERCTHVCLMYEGRMIANDTPNTLRDEIGATVLEAQSEQAKEARRAVEKRQGVLVASTHGNVIRLLVDSPALQGELTSMWASRAIPVENLRVVRPRLEDAFVLSVSRIKGNDGR